MPNKPSNLDDPFRGIKSGGWTKHAGGRQGLIHSQEEETWTCQACGKAQPRALPGFLLEVFPNSREYVRVCASCFHLARQNGYSYTRVTIIVRVDNRPLGFI